MLSDRGLYFLIANNALVWRLVGLGMPGLMWLWFSSYVYFIGIKTLYGLASNWLLPVQSRIDYTPKIFPIDLVVKVSHREEPYESLTANYLPC